MDLILKRSPATWYDANFLELNVASECFYVCNSLQEWNRNIVNGFPLSRETIVFADDDIYEKLQSKEIKVPQIWGENICIIKFPQELKNIKQSVEERTKETYNIALGNRYLRAKDKIAFHCDNEEFGNTQSIASISLGVPRTFTFVSKKEIAENEEHSLILTHGSLLFMGENCQENYLHGMKKEKISEDPAFGKIRINVTFRIWNY